MYTLYREMEKYLRETEETMVEIRRSEAGFGSPLDPGRAEQMKLLTIHEVAQMYRGDL